MPLHGEHKVGPRPPPLDGGCGSGHTKYIRRPQMSPMISPKKALVFRRAYHGSIIGDSITISDGEGCGWREVSEVPSADHLHASNPGRNTGSQPEGREPTWAMNVSWKIRRTLQKSHRDDESRSEQANPENDGMEGGGRRRDAVGNTSIMSQRRGGQPPTGLNYANEQKESVSFNQLETFRVLKACCWQKAHLKVGLEGG
jgi:hypothetical protein